ncbi:unnamed protein product [Parnassius mnemosyne]|uniref:Uncharacterized protein n=1 Tax=Parnassius mnemosyne TaxID=213953 RepID=A0AAV1KT63_9NEOP
MIIFRVFLLLVLSTSAFSDEDSLLRSCEIKDIECLSKSTEQFLEKTCKGIPEYDIRAIDPLEIPSLVHKLTDDGSISLHFKNLRITGLKNQKISDFQMDKATKSVLLKLNVDLNIVGEITIESSKMSKPFSGMYSAKATTLATANYEYDLTTDSKGVQHFKVLPERISCEIVGEPEVSISDDLLQSLQKEESSKEWQSKNIKKQKEFREKTICKLVEKAYVTVVHNIRAAAKFLPANAFFKDI